MYYSAEITDLIQAEAAKNTAQGVDHPSGYRPDPGLVDAINVALLLNRPILLTGEPGTGKSQAAYSAAWQLARRGKLKVASDKVEKFETKSTSVARDLFYAFDTLGRFHAAQSGITDEVTSYLTFNALGRALINALPEAAAKTVMPKAGYVHTGPYRSVVLVDEIDKAPRDFPNDLLNEIDQMYFRIPELPGGVSVGGSEHLKDDYRPIVFITSNSEKNLPDPFLRRCIFYHIPFPNTDGLRDILLSRLNQIGGGKGPLVEDCIKFFSLLRDRGLTQRKISPAELIQWITYLLRMGVKSDQKLAAVSALAQQGLSTLTKDPTDQKRVRDELNQFLQAK